MVSLQLSEIIVINGGKIRHSSYELPFPQEENLCTQLLKDLGPIREIVPTTWSGRLFETLEGVWMKLLSS